MHVASSANRLFPALFMRRARSVLHSRDVCFRIFRIADTKETQDSGGEPSMLRWMYGRADTRIDMYRSIDATSTQIDVIVGGHTQTFRFLDRRSLVAFQAGFEHALLQTGWQLLGFEPERRAGTDRRARQRGIERRGFPALIWSR